MLSCDKLTDAGLAALVGLTQLTRVTLADGTMLSSGRLVSLVGRLPKLRHLTLCNIAAVTDVSMATIVRATPKLQSLGLQQCNNLTDQGLALLVGLQHLTTFWIDACKQVTVGVLMALAACPGLQRLEVHTLSPGQSFGVHQQELLQKIKGPNLEVVCHRSRRPRAEVFALHSSLAAGCLCISDSTGLSQQGSLGTGQQGAFGGEMQQLHLGLGGLMID